MATLEQIREERRVVREREERAKPIALGTRSIEAIEADLEDDDGTNHAALIEEMDRAVAHLEAKGDREQTLRDEKAKAEARVAMENVEVGRATISTSDAESIRRFALAGNAIFTLVSKKSGERRTFRVVELDRVYAVKFLGGESNDDDRAYHYLGKIYKDTPDRYAHGGPKAKAGRDSDIDKLFGWFWRQLALAVEGEKARFPSRLDRVEFWHEGKCGRCGRRLTVPESIATGLGPVCAGRS